ncbi:hypothetical protein FXO38_29677 [Capsicum annuum]|nr:hypothetical protein FXO38_29677 [Capsicum annuum]
MRIDHHHHEQKLNNKEGIEAYPNGSNNKIIHLDKQELGQEELDLGEKLSTAAKKRRKKKKILNYSTCS